MEISQLVLCWEKCQTRSCLIFHPIMSSYNTWLEQWPGCLKYNVDFVTHEDGIRTCNTRLPVLPSSLPITLYLLTAQKLNLSRYPLPPESIDILESTVVTKEPVVVPYPQAQTSSWRHRCFWWLLQPFDSSLQHLCSNCTSSSVFAHWPLRICVT